MQDAPNAATLVQAVRAHSGEVACLDISGARLATGGGDRALRLWEWSVGAGWSRSGEARAAHRYGVVTVRWARAGQLLASGGVDGAVRLWAGRSLAARRQLAAPAATAVRALCWAGGGAARLLAGHDDGALCVWAPTRAPGAELLARLRPHEGAVHAIATPARDVLLLTACTDGVLKVFDLAEVSSCGVTEGAGPAPLQWVDGAHDMGVLCADASEAGTAATGGHDGVVRLWHAAEGSLRAGAALQGHTAAVTALRWGGEVLASAALDRTARLWMPASGACLLAVAAHPRYLTCVALAPDLRYLLTGSNDKSFRMWSLGAFSVEEEVAPPCETLSHFALGDLEGIGPVEDENDEEAAGGGEVGGAGDGEGEGSGARCVWSSQAHRGPVNCIATRGDLLATASSDGTVKVMRWQQDAAGGGSLEELHTLGGSGPGGAGEYPVLACDLGGAGGAVLLSAGLDGGASLWDVQTGVCVRTLVVPGGRGGEAGGGGVRGARLSPHRAPLALLATDDGLAPLWRLTDPDPLPLRVYAGHAEAATCCAWSADGRAAATGAASGELRLYAPPDARLAHHDSQAHDLGVLNCDFAPPSPDVELPEGGYLLATGGCDSLVKLWRVEFRFEEESSETGGGDTCARVSHLFAVSAHGGAVASVRWGAGGAEGAALLATAGADRWARVWRVMLDAGGARALQICAVPVRGAGGAPAAALCMRGSLLAVGSLAGELTLWRLEETSHSALDDEGAAPLLWREAGVARWMREYVLEAPGSCVPAAAAARLQARVLATGVTGARLLRDPLHELLHTLGFASSGAEEPDSEVEGDGWQASVLRRARDELQWLRVPPPPHSLEAVAPHALLCPLSHRVALWPARAADGFTYERANMAEWLAAGGALSPLSHRRLRSAVLAPNYRLTDALRRFLRDSGAGPPTHTFDTPDTAGGDTSHTDSCDT